MRCAAELLQQVFAQLPRKVPQPEHVVEEIVDEGPPWRVTADNRAELSPCCLRHQHKPENHRLLGARGAPGWDLQRHIAGPEVLCCFYDRLAVVKPEEP